MAIRSVFALGVALLITGCGSTYKERKAPCKRPQMSMAYGPDEAALCGPVRPVNLDRASVLAAIDEALGF